MQCRDYHAAKEACVTTLTHDSSNLTALIRAAKASLLDPASTYSEVHAALDAAGEQCETQQQQDQLQSLRIKYQRKLKAHKVKEKRMYSKMAQAAVVDKPKANSNIKKETRISTSASDKEENNKRKDRFSIRKFPRNVDWKRILTVYILQLLIPICFFWWLQKRQVIDKVPNPQQEE
jgi:Spy/CpxP family protein refolding chaperone